jgi:hypothetical protein
MDGAIAGPGTDQPQDRAAAPRGRSGSGDHEVEVAQDRRAAEGSELHRRHSRATPVGIVIKRSSGAVVDQVVIRVCRGGETGSRAERAGGQRAKRRQRSEDGVLQLNGVVSDIKVADRVTVAGGVEVLDAVRVSEPEPPVTWAVASTRLTVTPVVPLRP